MNLIKVLICDDNDTILTQINNLVEGWGKSNKINFQKKL